MGANARSLKEQLCEFYEQRPCTGPCFGQCIQQMINILFLHKHHVLQHSPSFKALVQNSWWPPIIHLTSSIGIGLSPHASQTMRRKGRRPAHLLALLGLLCVPTLLSGALSFIDRPRFIERTGGSEMIGMREHALTCHCDPNMILYIMILYNYI